MAWSSSTISALRDISLERTASGEERLCVSGTCAAVVGGKAKWPNMTGYHGSTTNVFPKVNWLADYADFSCPYCQVVGGSSATISGAHVALEASAASDWGAPNCGLVPADKWKLDISLDADLITLAP